MNYFIWINNEEVPVSESVYRAYWKGVRKERYFTESDIHNHVFSYDALDTEEMNGEDMFFCDSAIPVDEQVIGFIEAEQLHNAVNKLSNDEFYIINKLYFDNISMRRLSAESGISLSTLHYRHQRILKKLKSYLENKNTSFSHQCH